MGGGALFVEHGAIRYVLPSLVFHYIVVHRYRLPDVVEVALRQAAVSSQEAWEAHHRSLAALVEGAYPSHGAPRDIELLARLSRRAGLWLGNRREAIAYHEARTAAWREAFPGGVAEGMARGRRRGAESALLSLLARARIPLSDDDRARIRACPDQETIERWLDNVPGAKSAAAVLT